MLRSGFEVAVAVGQNLLPGSKVEKVSTFFRLLIGWILTFLKEKEEE
jgi:hypothetical protein